MEWRQERQWAGEQASQPLGKSSRRRAYGHHERGKLDVTKTPFAALLAL